LKVNESMSQNHFLEDRYEDQTFRGISLDHQEIREITFSGCSFIQCSFEEATFKTCRFQNCVFKKCNLSLTKVDDSAFNNTRFEDSKVIGVNWVKASWRKTETRQSLKSIDFYGCVLNYSSFMGLALGKINIQKCIARDVDFSETNLKQANCSFTDFTNSRFRHTDLTEADLVGAVNYFIQPHLNTLKKTRFSLPEALSLLYNLDIEIVEALNDEVAPDKQDLDQP
jgi:fluoroquinolone resistance protein